VRALLATAVEDGVIRSNPCAGIRLATTRPGAEEEPAVRALTPDDYARVLTRTPAEWRLLVRVLGETGMRIGEPAGLTWPDVDLGKRRIRVRRRAYKGNLTAPKSRHGRRTIPVTDDLAGAFWTAWGASALALDSDPVFTSPRGPTASTGPGLKHGPPGYPRRCVRRFSQRPTPFATTALPSSLRWA
jgi:integrase